MRSELVLAARHTLGNRYILCHAAAKATRRFHVVHSRIQDTTNEVLKRIAHSDQEPATVDCEHGVGKQRRSALSEHWKRQVQKLVG